MADPVIVVVPDTKPVSVSIVEQSSSVKVTEYVEKPPTVVQVEGIQGVAGTLDGGDITPSPVDIYKKFRGI